ncbi:MAG: family 78 glycoside hydrolase catalytic domain [Phycisphaeraceae bacterium]|nr:MAG: family 78 glycoside hydrolase catalytic domain [Phycisphaeraceae bacterium]
MPNLVWMLIVSTVAFAAWPDRPAPGDPAHLTATELRCEYRTRPIGVESPAPRLSWTLHSERRGVTQSAYRILVSSSQERLAADEGDVWDSGRVTSSRSVHVEYAGRPLTSRRVCHWKVMAWDGEGVAGAWSEPSEWEMGLLEPADWSAGWIDAGPRAVPVEIEHAVYAAVDGTARVDVTEAARSMIARGEPITASNAALGGDPAYGVRKRLEIDYRVGGASLRAEAPENTVAQLAGMRYPYLRRAFTVRGPVRSARLYASALGVYEPYLNGERVGDHHLAPGWTDYRVRVRSQVYDVTDRLVPGENVIGALVGPGWFSGRAGLFHARAFYGDSPALIAQLEITYADGSTDRIITDGSWRRHDGPVLAADLMDGEIHDAGAEIGGWCSPGIDESSWSPVTVREESRRLVAEVDEPVRVLREFPAVSLSEPSPGRWTFDLGQNIVGVARLRVRAAPGTVITLRHAEILNPDGTLYTANLRGAAATDTYIAAGSGEEVWQPRFTFHGFRYVEVTGLAERPGLGTITGIALGSDLPSAGEFACSDGAINQLQSNIVWGMKGNYLSIPTDCPQRDERMGWTADTQVFVPTAAYNADLGAFMTKWMTDVADAQREDGAHSDVAPVMKGLSYGTPAWADAGTIVPWALYVMYGDRRILEAHIEGMIRWVEWCRVHSTGLIRDRDRGNDYGDWLAIGADTPKDLIGTAYFAHSADLVARSLAVLGREREAERYRALFEEVRAAFIGRYLMADGRLAGHTQCAYTIALRFGLLPDSARGPALDHLIADIESKGRRLSTGFVGVAHLLPVLADHGRPDMAYRLLLQDQFPSWLFSVRHGATTVWERWDGWTPRTGPHPDASMNSFNHYALGSCGQWLFEGVAGISPDPEHPGFEHFLLRPRLEGPLNWARASYRSVRGEIVSAWALDGDRFTLTVRVPANTSATLTLPATPGEAVTESGVPIDRAAGVRVVRHEPGAVVLRLGSGLYEFTSTRPAAPAGNPVLSGWYADPEVAVFGGRYWIYPTYSAPYDDQTFFDAFSSPDLVHWTKHPRVLDAAAVPWARRAMWAPSVVHKNGRYWFFFSANDIQNDRERGGIGVAVADSPSGPFRDELGEPLVGAFHHGAQPIDQFVFRDDDGTDYLIYGGWGHCTIARLRDDYRGLIPFDDGTTFKEITPRGYVEGPFMFRRGGTYYFMWSEGGWTGPDYAVAYAVADSPMGPFERAGTILQQDPRVATGAGHHSVLRIPGRDEYYIVYHRRPLGLSDRNHRVVCIDRMTFTDDGRIEPVRITTEGVGPVRLPPP